MREREREAEGVRSSVRFDCKNVSKKKEKKTRTLYTTPQIVVPVDHGLSVCSPCFSSHAFLLHKSKSKPFGFCSLTKQPDDAMISRYHRLLTPLPRPRTPLGSQKTRNLDPAQLVARADRADRNRSARQQMQVCLGPCRGLLLELYLDLLPPAIDDVM